MKLWQIMLGGWLIVTGLIGLIGITFAGINIMMGILALIAGILILIDR
jgi:hypothetical protein